MTPAVLLASLVLAPVAFGDPLARQLGADMRAAIDRACQCPKGIALDLEIPLNKLYDQLNGNAAFTYLWRILAAYPDVKLEFYDLQIARANAVLVRGAELCQLVGGVRELIAAVPKRMAKASLPEHGRKAQVG